MAALCDEFISSRNDSDTHGIGQARTFPSSLRGRPLVVSIVCVEELLEGADDETAAFASLQRFTIQGLHLTQARRCALAQRRASRRLGENDAWLAATADSIDADVVGTDRAVFEPLDAAAVPFHSTVT